MSNLLALTVRRTWHRLVQRVLHARRRRRAHSTVAAMSPRSVLFLCHGNVCRSPFAAKAFDRAARLAGLTGMRIDSSGFIGPGRAPPPQAITAASRCGLDLSDHQSTVVTRQALDTADLVVVMAGEQATQLRRTGWAHPARVLLLGDFDPRHAATRDISDPWGRSDEDFDDTFARIDRCVRELARVERTARAPTTAAGLPGWTAV